MKVNLQRVAQSTKGTFGVLSVNDIPLCLTCEDPWNNNQNNISCIPAGVYKVVPHNGAKYTNVWRLEGVPGRSAILIHAGNTIKSTEGCILVGDSFGTVGGLPAVLNSVNTLKKLRQTLPPFFNIEIKDA